MDSGTREGTPADELARLSNNGTELNPTSAKPAPTARSEQQAAGAGGGGGGTGGGGGGGGAMAAGWQGEAGRPFVGRASMERG